MQETPEELRLRQSGEWWADPWWLKDNWFEVRPITSEQVRSAFEYLKKIFEPSWVRSYQGGLIENLFLRSVLYDRSAFTRSYLISLAERLKRLEHAKGIHVVIRNLRGRRESDAADMELELADVFAGEGYQVEFPIAKSSRGKSPDIRLQKGSSRLAVECKKLGIGDLAAWLGSVFNVATSQLFDLASKNGLGIEFAFSNEVVRPLLEDRSDGVQVEVAAINLVKRVQDEIEVAVGRGRWPLWLWIDKRGEGFLFKTGTTAGSTIQHPDVPDELLFRRMLQNALIPAAKQLSNEDAPGLIAVHARDVPSEELLGEELNRFLRENREAYAHILAVLVIPWQGWFHRNQSQLIVNRYSRFDWENSDVSVALGRFDPIIF